MGLTKCLCFVKYITNSLPLHMSYCPLPCFSSQLMSVIAMFFLLFRPTHLVSDLDPLCPLQLFTSQCKLDSFIPAIARQIAQSKLFVKVPVTQHTAPRQTPVCCSHCYTLVSPALVPLNHNWWQLWPLSFYTPVNTKHFCLNWFPFCSYFIQLLLPF